MINSNANDVTTTLGGALDMRPSTTKGYVSSITHFYCSRGGVAVGDDESYAISETQFELEIKNACK